MAAASIADLDTLLDELQVRLPQLIADYPDAGDFWVAFAGETEVIEENAGDQAAHVMQRINAMLAEHGRMIAGIELEG